MLVLAGHELSLFFVPGQSDYFEFGFTDTQLITQLFNLESGSSTCGLQFNTVTYGKHSLRCLGPFLWSKLDKKVKNSEFLNTFKAEIRKLYLVGMIEDNCKNCTLGNS